MLEHEGHTLKRVRLYGLACYINGAVAASVGYLPDDLRPWLVGLSCAMAGVLGLYADKVAK